MCQNTQLVPGYPYIRIKKKVKNNALTQGLSLIQYCGYLRVPKKVVIKKIYPVYKHNAVFFFCICESKDAKSKIKFKFPLS